MDIHVKVEKPEYLILSQRAEELGLQIGHYCARVIRASLEPDPKDEIIDELKKHIREQDIDFKEIQELYKDEVKARVQRVNTDKEKEPE